MKVYWAGVVFLGCALSAGAATLYVNVNAPSHRSPYTNWATAAATIQDAVDVSVDGDEVVVANGVYSKGGRVIYGAMTNRVAIDRAITVRSVDGPAITLINGGLGDTNGGIRCAYLTNGAALVGFTLTNGMTRTAGDGPLEQNGGAVWCASTNAVVSDCVLAGNRAEMGAGAAYGGTLNNCTILRNSSHWGVGGAYSNTLNHCTLSDNQGGAGGAMYSILNGCTVTANSSYFAGGAGFCLLNKCFLAGNTAYALYFNPEVLPPEGGGAYNSTLNNCVLSNNFALLGGGAYNCSLYNCVLINNTASFYGGGAAFGVLDNCTVVGNSAGLGGGMAGSSATNSILYFNAAVTNYPNYSYTPAYSTVTYCCTFPQPASGSGNITNRPLWVNYAGGNFRLQSNSPCIDAGNNAAVVQGLPDLDGRPRIVNGTVDIGAFEFQPGVSGEFIGWLGQYGLPTDGSADHVDSDGDGMDNWQEWVAGTNPTNPRSVLKMLTASPGPAGITVSWQSVTKRNYCLERSSSLEVQFPFQVLVSNIVGQAGSTTFIDTNAPSSSSAFYRVGVSR